MNKLLFLLALLTLVNTEPGSFRENIRRSLRTLSNLFFGPPPRRPTSSFTGRSLPPIPNFISDRRIECGISSYTQREPRFEFLERRGLADLFWENSNYVTKRILDNSVYAARSLWTGGEDEYENDKTARIINGERSYPGAWPWMVSLKLIHATNPRMKIDHWCGGVIIHVRWVLTAAHCFRNKNFNLPQAKHWLVVAGRFDRHASSPQHRHHRIQKIIIHHSFTKFYNDIALVKLRRPLRWNKYIKPVCLPNTLETINSSFTGIKCVMTGWGNNGRQKGLQSLLHQVTTSVLPLPYCKYRYEEQYEIDITEQHLCSGDSDSPHGTCIGDSGGPLQCNMRDGRWYLAGVASFGPGCYEPESPDVSMRVTHFLPWIQFHMTFS